MKKNIAALLPMLIMVIISGYIFLMNMSKDIYDWRTLYSGITFVMFLLMLLLFYLSFRNK